jgi:hypothetical protein
MKAPQRLGADPVDCSFEEKGEEHFAIIPLLTVTAAMIKT